MGHKKADDNKTKNNQTSSRVSMAVDTCYSAYGGTFIDSSLQVFLIESFQCYR
jgi:N-acetylmuramoyl-L-alanine amidase CwlA